MSVPSAQSPASRPVRLSAAARLVGVLTLLGAPLAAQTALGTPFIGANNLSFSSSQLTRTGGPEITTLFGASYARQFGSPDQATHTTLAVRVVARPFDEVKSGVVDMSVTFGMSYDVPELSGLSVAASAGIGMMAWGDDVANTGRSYRTVPASAGVSYDLHLKRLTISPFAMASLGRYDLRTYVDDVRQSSVTGWDTNYRLGASVRLKELVLTTARIIGEEGMPTRSRWAFSAGISF